MYRDFTFDTERFPPTQVATFVAQLHADNRYYVLITDPAILAQPGYAPYDSGLRAGVFINTSDGITPCVGQLWAGVSVYPDFT